MYCYSRPKESRGSVFPLVLFAVFFVAYILYANQIFSGVANHSGKQRALSPAGKSVPHGRAGLRKEDPEPVGVVV